MPSSSELPPDSSGSSRSDSLGSEVGSGPVDPAGSGPDSPSDPAGHEDGIYESSGVYESDDGIYDEDPEDSSGGGWRLSRLNVGLLTLSVAALSAALYISPAGSDVRQQVQEALPGSTVSKIVADPTPSATPSSTATSLATPGAGASASLPGASSGSGPNPLGSGTSAAGGTSGTGSASGVSALSPNTSSEDGQEGQEGQDRQGSGSGAGTSTTPSPLTQPTAKPKPTVKPTSTPTVKTTPKPTPKPAAPTPTTPAFTKCYQFTWQQDAQRAYQENLSDPYGLDADPGPNDGDGLACTELPVDAARAPSTPAGAYSPPKPTAANKRALVTPTKDYFGFLQNGVPGDTAAVEKLTEQAGKAPSTTGWFSSFDQPYRGDLVEKSWSRGALPVVTWMPTDAANTDTYSLTSIINGTHDRYLRRYAGDVVREGLPVSLRFGHEMNGNWYGWSAGRADFNNTPTKYVEAWKHIWQVFDDVGATDDVIWLWSPGRVDNLKPGVSGVTTLAQDYPGDAYVDWVGASVYLRKANVGPTYEASFAKTVNELKAVTDKPIFFGEIGAAQTDGAVDQTALKTAWVQNVLASFVADQQVVGFLWFNNVAATVINGESVTNDWRFDASPATQDAFKLVVDSQAFAEGMAPD